MSTRMNGRVLDRWGHYHRCTDCQKIPWVMWRGPCMFCEQIERERGLPAKELEMSSATDKKCPDCGMSFAVTIGMDSMRICIGMKPINHTAEDVLRWINIMLRGRK